MRDYPVIVSRAQTSFLGSKPKKPVQKPLDRPFIFRRDSREVEYLKFEMTELYEHRGKIQTLASEDIQKIGCMFVFYQLLRNAGQQAYSQFHDHTIITIYDLMYQRARKSGFCQITILAQMKFIQLFNNIANSVKTDEWSMALSQMFNYIDLQFGFWDLNSKQYVTEEKDNMKIVEKRQIILPSTFNVLQRLEGLRRIFVPQIMLLCKKLTTLCAFYKNLSAIDDMPIILGVLVDILETSDQNTNLKSAVIEYGLPALLKILRLIIDRKIKSRQYYVFISHRLMQIFNSLVSMQNTALQDF